MSFEPGHVFVKSCLQAIPKVYDPYNWGTIGPLLLSKMTKGRNNVSPKIYPRVCLGRYHSTILCLYSTAC